jgi:hypothetical protein
VAVSGSAGAAAPLPSGAASPVGPGNSASTSTGADAGAGAGGTSPAVPVAMPDLIGKNAATARIELERLGFRDVRFGSQDLADPDVFLPQNWTVTRQSAAAGVRVPTDTAIVLTCTRRV